MTKATRWTDEKIKAVKLPDGKKEKRVLVAPGLYLFTRAKRGGALSKQWQYRAQVDGKRRWLSLGSYPAVGLAQAATERQTHEKAHQAALKGEADHPVIAAQLQRLVIREQPTVAEAFDEWMADKRLGSPRKGGKPVREKTIKILQDVFDRDIADHIGAVKMTSVSQQSIRTCIDAPRKRGSPSMAGHVYKTMRGLINFGIGRGYITGADPMRGIENPAPYQPKPPNAAKDIEIVTFFKVFEAAQVWPGTRLAASLQIYTGARPGEVLKARWEHVDLEKRIWTIPEDDDKSGRGFKVHLSDGAVTLLQEALNLKGDSDLVFPGPRSVDGSKALGNGVIGQAIKRFKKQTTDENFRLMKPHDLRKTLKTMMSRIGIKPHISELCLNHTEKNILVRIYDGHDYWSEMVDAWDRAGAHLDSLRGGGALVIPIATGRKIA